MICLKCLLTKDVYYKVQTSATLGEISTQYFGDKFEAGKVDGRIFIDVYVYKPEYSKRIENNTILMFEIENVMMNKAMVKYYNFKDSLNFDDASIESEHYRKNISIGSESISHTLTLSREVPNEYIQKVKSNLMPGFDMKWKYDGKVEKWTKFIDEEMNREFVRSLDLAKP